MMSEAHLSPRCPKNPIAFRISNEDTAIEFAKASLDWYEWEWEEERHRLCVAAWITAMYDAVKAVGELIGHLG